MLGQIESFNQVDAVGTVRVDDGREVRFGRSSCGFEPVVGTRVEILGTTAGFRGALKATALRLAEDRAAHASRVGARDASLGVRPPTVGAKEAEATARELAGLTILLDEDIPREIGALLTWALAFGFEQQGIHVEAEGPTLVFLVRGAKVRAFFGHDQYPGDAIDRAQVGDGFSTGKGSVSLLFSFMPRSYYTEKPDAWLEAGHARAMSRIAKVLLSRGHAVIVHRADELVIPGPRFAARLGKLDDLEFVPFSAWVDVRPVSATALGTVGLRAFGLPEVRVEGDAEKGTWLSARRFEAAVFAAYCLCRSMWIKDGLFEVPRRIQVGAYPPQLLDPVDLERWDARAEGAGIDLSGNVLPMVIVLRHRDDSDDASAKWALASRAGASDPSKLGHGGYEALYLHSLQTWLSLGQVGMFSCLDAKPPHRVITLRGDGPHLVIVSSGIGRVAQPGGRRENGSDHVELIAFVPASGAPVVGEIIAVIAGMVHAPDRRALSEPWALYETQLGCFLLRPWGPVAMGAGAPITLLELVPLTAPETESLRASPDARPKLLATYDQAASAARWVAITGR